MDQRDALTWVTLELTPEGEEMVRAGTLPKVLRESLGVADDFPVFIPAATYIKGGTQVTILLMEGYAFIGTGLEDTAYFALERRPEVAQVLSAEIGRWKLRTPLTVPDSRIAELRQKLQDQTAIGVAVGDSVKVLHGRFRYLEGVVQGINGDLAFVGITLRSLEVIAGIPRSFLEILGSSAPEKLTD